MTDDKKFLPIDEVFRAYPILWFCIILGTGVLASSKSFPKGETAALWLIDNLVDKKTIIIGIAGLAVSTIILAVSHPRPVPPPQGFFDVPTQWRLWVGAICIMGGVFSIILLGFFKP